MLQYTQHVETRLDNQLSEFRKETDRKFANLETRMDQQFQSLHDDLVPLTKIVTATEITTNDLKSIVFGNKTGLRDRVQALEYSMMDASGNKEKIENVEKRNIAEDASKKTINQTIIIVWSIILGVLAALEILVQYFRR